MKRALENVSHFVAVIKTVPSHLVGCISCLQLPMRSNEYHPRLYELQHSIWLFGTVAIFTSDLQISQSREFGTETSYSSPTLNHNFKNRKICGKEAKKGYV